MKITTHSKPRSVCSGYSVTLYSIKFLFIVNTSFPCYSFGRKIGVVWENASDFYTKLFNQKLLLEERNDYLFHNKDILQQPHSLLDFYFFVEIKISISLHCLSGQSFLEYNKESASLLVKSPISTKNTRSTVTTHKRGLPIRACIQAFGDAYKSAWKVAHFL